MDRILKTGFQKVGLWKLNDDQLALELSRPHDNAKNVLYAFVSNGDVKYIYKAQLYRLH